MDDGWETDMDIYTHTHIYILYTLHTCGDVAHFGPTGPVGEHLVGDHVHDGGVVHLGFVTFFGVYVCVCV